MQIPISKLSAPLRAPNSLYQLQQGTTHSLHNDSTEVRKRYRYSALH